MNPRELVTLLLPSPCLLHQPFGEGRAILLGCFPEAVGRRCSLQPEDLYKSQGTRGTGRPVAGGPWSSVSTLPEPATGKRDGQWVAKVACSLLFLYLAVER